MMVREWEGLRLVILTLTAFFSISAMADYHHESEFLPKMAKDTIDQRLLENLNPQDQSVHESFLDVSDTSALDIVIGKDSDHLKFGQVTDAANMLGFKIQVDKGKIQPGTMIVYDSGHSLPVAAYFMREFYDQFNIQTVLHLPVDLNLNLKATQRLHNHASKWGKELAWLQAQHARKGNANVIFLGLEAHRKENGTYSSSYDPNLLPNSEELKKIGITKIIYMTEAHPDAETETVKSLLRSDTKAYLDSLDLPIEFLGSDCRRETQCWNYVGRKNPHGKFGIF